MHRSCRCYRGFVAAGLAERTDAARLERRLEPSERDHQRLLGADGPAALARADVDEVVEQFARRRRLETEDVLLRRNRQLEAGQAAEDDERMS